MQFIAKCQRVLAVLTIQMSPASELSGSIISIVLPSP